MESTGRGNPPEGVDVPIRKSRKDPSSRASSKASSKDGRTDAVSHDLLRATRSESASQITPTHPAMSTSRSRTTTSETVTPSSNGRGSQSTLAEFDQTASTVSMLVGLSKSRQDKKNLDNIVSKSSEEKKRKVELEAFKFSRQPQAKTTDSGQGQSFPSAPPSTTHTMSPLRKSSWPSYGSPSPPPRRSGTPVLDEPNAFAHYYDDQVGVSRVDRAVPGHSQFTAGLQNAGLFQNNFMSGIPQGSTITPQSMMMDYPQGLDPRLTGRPNQTQPLPDIAAIFKEGFDRMLNKIGDLRANNLPRPSAGIAEVSEVKQEDLSDEDTDGEESFVSWSGQKLVNKTPTVVVSEDGMDAWKALKGLDNAGIEAGLFKKIVRKDKEINFYSKGGRCFAPQEKNLELPKCTGYKERDEKKLYQKDKALGAIGAALVAAIDAARECADDLSAAKQDFEQDVIEDLKRAAVETCAASNNWINEKVVHHLVRALKMTAVESALITSERRTLAESEVSHEDMRKILADSPPDDTFLYGGAVKDSVQKARDASLLSKAFNQYGNRREKPWEKTSVYRPRNLRFKAGRKFKGKAESWKKDNRRLYKGLKKDQYKKE